MKNYFVSKTELNIPQINRQKQRSKAKKPAAKGKRVENKKEIEQNKTQ